ncbi:MAG: tetratricopeptide repeat protein [Chthoniobacterales bacterium]|nr:tetratricopeptide repeat protein [Chthoniobacterales bacterium]
MALFAKNYEQSLAHVKHMLAQDPDNVEALLVQAQLWLATGETKKAVEQLEQLDQKYAGVPVIKYQLARAHLQNNNAAQATLVLEQAVAANPEHTEAVATLAELYIRMAKPQPAINLLEKLYKGEPANAQVRRLLADAYRNAGRLDDAVAIFQAQIKSVPNFAEPHFFLGILFRDQKKPDEAREAFTKASELEPDNPGPIEQLVELDIAEARFDAAMERVQRQIQKNPSSAPAHFLQAKVYIAQQQRDAAESALLKAIELDPNLEVAYRLLIANYIAAAKLPEAASRLEEILSKSPNNANALQTLGMIYSEMKVYDKAREAYEKVLALQPSAALALNNLAYIYSEQPNQLERAQELASRARNIAPAEPHVAGTLGWILFKKGDYQQALGLLRESAEKLPDSALAQYHFGLAASMMGDTEAARVALERAVSSTTDFKGKDDAQRRLSLLQPADGREISIAELEVIIKEQPDDLQALVRLAEQYEKQGEHVRAAEVFNKAFQLNPRLLSVVLKIAQLNAGPLQNPERALEFAKKARELAPADPNVAGMLGEIAFKADNFPWAYSLLQESARQRADDPQVLASFAEACYSVGRVAEAVETMQRVLKTNPNAVIAESAQLFLDFVRLEADPSALTTAEAHVRQVLQNKPDYLPAIMAQAGIDAQRDVSVASARYEAILRRYPDFAPAQKRLAALYVQDPGKSERAYALATSARRTLPDDPELAPVLARLSYQRKEYRRVIQLLQESERSKPLEALSLFYLGMSQFQTNQKPAGRLSLEKALAGGLPEAETAESSRVLEKAQ